MRIYFLAALLVVFVPAAAGAIEPPSSLHIVDTKIGDGRMTETGNGVSVHYTGWIFDSESDTDNPCMALGKVFDSTRGRQRPFNFPLGEGRVIEGWDKGVTGMRVGGKRCLVIPPSMAYGERGAGGGAIPPNATLVFEVELLSVADF